MSLKGQAHVGIRRHEDHMDVTWTPNLYCRGEDIRAKSTSIAYCSAKNVDEIVLVLTVGNDVLVHMIHHPFPLLHSARSQQPRSQLLRSSEISVAKTQAILWPKQ